MNMHGRAGQVAAIATLIVAVFFIAAPSHSGAESPSTPLRLTSGLRWANEFFAVGDRLFFKGNESDHGSELWVSDGTRNGTRMVKDIHPGDKGSELRPLAAIGDTLYFRADDGVHGRELWRTDGTRRGTRLVADIRPGSEPSWPNTYPGPAVIGDSFLFAADDGVHHTELWRTDGTEAGTRMVKDIHRNPDVGGSSFPSEFVVMDGIVYFIAFDDDHGWELWRSDGTEPGTRMVADIDPGKYEIPGFLKVVGNQIFFEANDGVHGDELWRSDGTADGTFMVRDLRPGERSSWPREGAGLNGILYFNGNTAEGADVWRSDGTFEGTWIVADHERHGLSNPQEFTQVGPWLFFHADRPAQDDDVDDNDNALWRTDGTSEGTHLVTDLPETRRTVLSSEFTALGDRLYFVIGDSEYFRTSRGELWVSDGTEAGTRRVADIYPGPRGSKPDHLTVAGDRLFFLARDPEFGNEVWVVTD